MKLAFLLSKGLLCLYDKQNNTQFLEDMKFFFVFNSTSHSLRSLMSNQVKHSKRNSISTHAHVLFPIYHPRLKWNFTVMTYNTISPKV